MTLHGQRVAILVEDFYRKFAGANFLPHPVQHSVWAAAGWGHPPCVALRSKATGVGGAWSVLGRDTIKDHACKGVVFYEANWRGHIIGAICHAGWVLVSAGILRGRTVTCFCAIKDDVLNAGARYVDQEVVRDRNLITSRKPDDLPAFMRAFLEALEGRSMPSSRDARTRATALSARR